MGAFRRSIIFTIGYVALTAVALWRAFRPSSRTAVLIRPLIFIALRLGTYAVRIAQSTGHYGIALFITEQVLLLSGFILLIEPLLSLTFFHVTRFNSVDQPARRLERLFRWLRVLIVASLALGIYAGTQMGDPDAVTRVKVCRDVNVVICLAVTLFAGVFNVSRQLRDPRLPYLQTAHLIAIAVLLTLASAYRLELYANDHVPDSLHRGTKIAFYLLSALPEFVATMLFVAFDLNMEFDIPAARRRKREAKAMRKNGGVWSEADSHTMESV